MNEKERQAALDNYKIVESLPEQTFDDFTLIASQICNTPIALISLIDNDRQWFKSKYGIGISEGPRDLSFCGHAINEPDQIFQVENAKIDKRFSDNPLVTGNIDISFYAGVPLVDSQNFALGTLCVIDKKPKKLTENQLKALVALSRQVMFKIEERRKNILLNQTIDVKSNDLQNLEFNYLQIYNESPDMMLSVDPNTKKIIRCNETTCLKLEYSKSEIYEKKLSQIYHPDCFDEMNLVFHEFKNNKSLKNKRLILKTKSGKKINVAVSINAVKNKNGDIIYSNSVLRDIDDLIETENKLRLLNKNLSDEVSIRSQEVVSHKERLELALAAARDAIFDWKDVKLSEVWWSPRFNEILGYHSNSKIKKNIRFLIERIHEEDKKTLENAINNCIKESSPFTAEFRIKTNDGQFKWVRAKGSAVKNNKEEVYRVTGSLTEINEQKNIELELVNTKRFLEKVTKIAPSIIYVFDHEKMSNIYSNKEIGHVLGYTSDEVQIMGNQLMPLLCHPDDLDRV
ncbi:MAG: PAS domain-containing protein, partial [Putridiphycobacter sp.]|nr:PAS domain-containing protein [Putridiphycobacter sp.]